MSYSVSAEDPPRLQLHHAPPLFHRACILRGEHVTVQSHLVDASATANGWAIHAFTAHHGQIIFY
ncbi:hypothetical protein [Stenotrophomonas rhizophila]|jgi:hypothetical protein|uniref:hypothetical protein n=1 Tax=Stenotrophomonas rhizophila TaxID=216778 RepID=UPI0028D57207|nr:hypothetical protein [Stenotrophomonas rhizophila]